MTSTNNHSAENMNSQQPFRRLVRVLYSKKYLLWTNTATGVLLFGVSDVAVQRFVEKKKTIEELDGKRIGMSCLASGLMSLLGHKWYIFLDGRFPSTSTRTVLKKMSIELALGPPFISTILLLIGKLKGKTIIEIWQNDIKSNLGYFILADLCLFTPLQFVNFKYVPPRYRILYLALVSLFTDPLMVYLLHKTDIDRIRVQKTSV